MAVVVPVLNGASEIGSCVQAVLAQTRPPDEVIVVDNGSTDGTGDAARAAGATVMTLAERGVYRARNVGWRATDAEVVAFTDADCVPAGTWLERLLGPFEDGDVAGAGGEAVLPEVRTPAQRWAKLRGFMVQETNFNNPFMPFLATANAAYRRTALDAVGGFEETFLSGGDTDIAWRIQAFAGGRLVFRPDAEVVHHFAEHWSELTSRSRRYAGGHAAMRVRWSRWPRFVAAQGSFLQRTRGLWLLPARLPYRAVTRGDMSVPLIDAAVRASYEVGLAEGARRARQLGVTALPGPDDDSLLAGGRG
ncbi:MAG TPA: glycosyltransferase family A protein [Acidimicrobiales bacterium]|nr:glycosyltransferase family A protein [Acidimicrobiales bacterium]